MTLAQLAINMRPDERALLKVGKIPGRHLAAIKQGRELQSRSVIDQTRAGLECRITQLESALTAKGLTVPTQTAGGTRRGLNARIDSLEKALRARGVAVPAPVANASRAKATATGPAATRPLTQSEHRAAVSKARVDSIRSAQDAERQAERDKELAEAKAAGGRYLEGKKRGEFSRMIDGAKAARSRVDAELDREADAAEARAMGKPLPVHSKPKTKAKLSDSDNQAVAAFTHHAAMEAGPERETYYRAHRRAIVRGSAITESK